MTFALSVAAVFSAFTVAGLLYLRSRERLFLAFLVQIVAYAMLILVANLGAFGGLQDPGLFLSLHLGAQAFDVLALGFYVTLLVGLPFRRLGWVFAAVSVLTAAVALSGFWTPQAGLDGTQQGLWLVGVDGLLAAYVVAMTVTRWRTLAPGMARRLLGLYFGVTVVELVLAVGNRVFWGYGTLNPVSLENLNLIVFCGGSVFVLGRDGFRAEVSSSPLNPTPGPLGDETRLSDREKEVVALVIRGLSNKDIALDLSLSSATVRNHLSRIFPKLGVQSRFELISLYKNPT